MTTSREDRLPGRMAREDSSGGPSGALRFLLARADAAQVTVGHRPLSVYDQITGTRPFTAGPYQKDDA